MTAVPVPPAVEPMKDAPGSTIRRALPPTRATATPAVPWLDLIVPALVTVPPVLMRTPPWPSISAAVPRLLTLPAPLTSIP